MGETKALIKMQLRAVYSTVGQLISLDKVENDCSLQREEWEEINRGLQGWLR